MEGSGSELDVLGEQARDAWEQNAAFWDEHMGEGGVFQSVLIGPATERLLDVQTGQRILDIACGNGAFSRRLAALGAHVVAGDFTTAFIERARGRTKENAERIEYLVVDATDETHLLALGPRHSFDAAVCTMGLMDMAAIDPLFAALSQLLKAGGPFVFSVNHPCFNTGGAIRAMEEEDRDGDLTVTHSVKVSRYVHPWVERGLGVVGQPVPQYYFARPISALFGAGFRAGFVLDGLEEPAFDGSVPSGRRPFSWPNYTEIPPVLIARMRLLGERSPAGGRRGG